MAPVEPAVPIEPAVQLPSVDLPQIGVSSRPWSEALTLADDASPGPGPLDAVVVTAGAAGPGTRALEVAARYGIDLVAELGGPPGPDGGGSGPAAPDGEASDGDDAASAGGGPAGAAPAAGASAVGAEPAPSSGTGVTAKAGSVHTVRLPHVLDGVDVPWAGLPRRLLVVRTGTGTASDMRAAGLELGRALAGRTRALVVLEQPDATGEDAGAPGLPAGQSSGQPCEDPPASLAAGIWLDAYRLPTAARKGHGPAPVKAVEILHADAPAVPQAGSGGLGLARESVTATHRARALTATRSTVKNPAWMAAAARHLVDGLDGATRALLRVEVADDDELRRRGAGAILAVGTGSPTPPRLVTVTYTPTGGSGSRVALVGKGITFDSGGLSKKPTSGMLTMSTDMAGSAVVLATVLAAARLRLSHTVTAVLPLAENAFGAGSYRPGDVVRTLSGRTVEIGNTDAEGRLVLADGLTHAIVAADPDVVVDVATLTGAARIALGTRTSALFATDDELAAALGAAGEAAGEQVWRLPMPADSEAALDSDVADVRQTPRGDVHTVGGTIFAAMFLRRFTEGRRWAHLDIAGTGRSTGGERLPSGAPTGIGAALLVHWLTALD